MEKSKLTKLREKNNYSQTEVAKTLSISDARLHYYETGKRKVPRKIAERLACLYKVSIEEIFLPETFSMR